MIELLRANLAYTIQQYKKTSFETEFCKVLKQEKALTDFQVNQYLMKAFNNNDDHAVLICKSLLLLNFDQRKFVLSQWLMAQLPPYTEEELKMFPETT